MKGACEWFPQPTMRQTTCPITVVDMQDETPHEEPVMAVSYSVVFWHWTHPWDAAAFAQQDKPPPPPMLPPRNLDLAAWGGQQMTPDDKLRADQRYNCLRISRRDQTDPRRPADADDACVRRRFHFREDKMPR